MERSLPLCVIEALLLTQGPQLHGGKPLSIYLHPELRARVPYLWVPSSNPGRCGQKKGSLPNGARNQPSADGFAGAPFVPLRLRPTEDGWIWGGGMLHGVNAL
eukprot:1148305-Pelagomonas_calceolata.AAC.4